MPGEKYAPLTGLVSRVRWIVPLLIAFIGVGWVVLEQVVVQGHSLFSPHVVRSILVIGVAGPGLAWLILDWTNRVAVAEAEAQKALAFRNRELAALNAIGDVTSQSLDLGDILRTALEKIVELMRLEAGEMRIVEGDALVLRAHHGISVFKAKERTVQLGHCVCGTCAQTGKTISMDDLPMIPSMAETPCAQEGLRSLISVPMKAKGKVLGVILLGSRIQHTFGYEDQQILGAIGLRVAMAVENARLYDRLHHHAMQLETASLVGQRITALLDLDSLLGEIVRLIRGKFGYYHVGILLADEETREVVLKDASGPGAEEFKARGLRLKIGQEGMAGWVAYTGQTILCNDVTREPRFHPAELLPETRSELAVPLRVGDRIIGVLDVQSRRRDALEKDDLTILQIMANQLGAAIENARLFQETRRRYEAMIALHETSLDMVSQLDAPKLLEALLRRGALLLDAHDSALFLYDSRRDLIYNVAKYNIPRDWSAIALRPGEGVIGQVILTGQPLIVNDYKNWQHKAAVFDDLPQTRALGAPLKWQDQIVGGIVVGKEPNAAAFDKDDLWLLSQFADLATIAIKNAELHTRVKEFTQELEHKVLERTADLSRARDEIADKADQLRSLLAKTIHIQEEERARIARDMHDGVIQLLTATSYELQAVKVVAGRGLTTAAQQKLNAAFEVLQEMEREIRRTIYDLHPPILDAVGLAPAIQKYVDAFKGLTGIACAVEVLGNPRRLPPQTEVAIFRMVEEALQNVATHAGAKMAGVTLDYGPATLCVNVQDAGQGFDYEQWVANHSGNHLGLVGMQERVKSVGGEMEIHSQPGQGTRILFRVPVQERPNVVARAG